VLGLEKVEELRFRTRFFDDAVADVRAVETRHKHLRAVETEAGNDLLARYFVRGRRERDARNVRKLLVEHRELDVLGAEIVTPLRHTVRFIDGEQRDTLRRLQSGQQ